MPDIAQAEHGHPPHTIPVTLELVSGPRDVVLYDFRCWKIIDGEASVFTANVPSGIKDPHQPVTVHLVPVGSAHPKGLVSRGVEVDARTGFMWEMFTAVVI